MKNRYSAIVFYFLLLVIIYLPFSELITSSVLVRLPLRPGGIFWLAHWYEPIAVLIFVFTLLGRGIRRLNTAEILLFVLVVLGLFSAIWSPNDFGRTLEGFRFTLFALLLLFITFRQRFSSDQSRKLVKIYGVIAVIIAALAIVERFLPDNYWQMWGITREAFGFGSFTVGLWQRSSSFMSGPNQLGSYMLPAFFLLLARKRKINRDTRYNWSRIISLMLILTGIVLSFSRAALAGLIVGILVYFVFFEPRRRIRIISIVLLVGLLGIGGAIYLRGSSVARDLLLHGESQVGHNQALIQTENELSLRYSTSPLKFWLGAGLGTAGPLAIKYRDGIVSESWYLQLLLEIGIVGLAAWLAFIFYLSRDLLRSKETGLFLGLLAVSTAALFLHTFADNPTLSITLFSLIGLSNNKLARTQDTNKFQ